MNIPINLTGGDYQHNSGYVSKQRTLNLFPELVDTERGHGRYILRGWPGLILFGAATSGSDRGMFEFKNVLYRVCGSTLYSIDSAGVHTSLMTISGVDRCIIDGIGNDIVITTNGSAYYYDTSLSSGGSITDVDLESPNACAHLNNQIIYDGSGNRFCTSDVGDPTSINGLNYAAAESKADNLIRPYVFNQLLYLFCSTTTETWYNSGVGSPPFDRIEGGILPIGLSAIYSTANNDNFIYFIADDNRVYQLVGTSYKNITDIAFANALESYTTISDAIGICYNFQNQNFYQITFPFQRATWCYSESTNQWIELSSNDGRYLANSHAFVYRKNIVADYNSANLYYFDINTYTENGDTIKRLRQTGPLHGGIIGAPGKWVEMERFELIMETGVGLSSGQGIDPQVMISFSDDGGKTFGTELWGSVGEQIGDYIKVEWFALGGFYSRIIRIRMSDPVKWTIIEANADLEVGI